MKPDTRDTLAIFTLLAGIVGLRAGSAVPVDMGGLYVVRKWLRAFRCVADGLTREP